MRTILIAAVTVPILCGCTTAPPIATPSGQPEISLSNVDFACVRSGFLNSLVDAKFSIRATSDSQIVAEQQSQNLMANALLSSRAGGFPEDRLTLLFIALPNDDMRIIVTEQYVTNAGTAFEKATMIGQSQAMEDQFVMSGNRIQTRCAKSPPK